MRIAPLDPFRRPTHVRSDTAVRLIALAVIILGLLNLWSALLARGPGRGAFLHDTVHLPLVVQHASRTVIALFGFGLMMLARSLARHKRQAWWIALFLSVLSPLPHLFKGLDYEEAIISLVLAVILLVFRHAFYAENDTPSARQGIAAAMGLFLLTAVYGPAGYFLLRAKFTPNFTWDRGIRQTTHQVFFYPPIRALKPRRGTPRAYWFDNSLQTVSVLSLAYCLIMLLRPVLPRERHGEIERARARKLLATFGADPISYFALLHDKRYLFDETGYEPAWGVAYVVVGRTAVVLGDPFGDPARATEAISGFLALCRRHDWAPVFYQICSRNIDAYRREKLRPLKVGEDALLDLPTWSMKGKAFQDLRTGINKMGRTWTPSPKSGCSASVVKRRRLDSAASIPKATPSVTVAFSSLGKPNRSAWSAS
jgi:phosphatidylglycerol lysyltransferase